MVQLCPKCGRMLIGTAACPGCAPKEATPTQYPTPIPRSKYASQPSFRPAANGTPNPNPLPLRNTQPAKSAPAANRPQISMPVRQSTPQRGIPGAISTPFRYGPPALPIPSARPSMMQAVRQNVFKAVDSEQIRHPTASSSVPARISAKKPAHPGLKATESPRNTTGPPPARNIGADSGKIVNISDRMTASNSPFIKKTNDSPSLVKSASLGSNNANGNAQPAPGPIIAPAPTRSPLQAKREALMDSLQRKSSVSSPIKTEMEEAKGPSKLELLKRNMNLQSQTDALKKDTETSSQKPKTTNGPPKPAYAPPSSPLARSSPELIPKAAIKPMTSKKPTDSEAVQQASATQVEEPRPSSHPPPSAADILTSPDPTRRNQHPRSPAESTQRVRARTSFVADSPDRLPRRSMTLSELEHRQLKKQPSTSTKPQPSSIPPKPQEMQLDMKKVKETETSLQESVHEEQQQKQGQQFMYHQQNQQQHHYSNNAEKLVLKADNNGGIDEYVGPPPPSQRPRTETNYGYFPKKPQLPLCSSCSQPIASDYMQCKEKLWHRECFVCTQCGVLLDGPFVEFENRIYCEKDYTALFGPRCFGCGSPIIGSAVEIEGSLYHQECLVCWQCGIHFGVGDEYISVDNMTLHPSCFCCFRCGAVIGEAEYGFEGEGKYSCERCFKSHQTPSTSANNSLGYMSRARASVQLDKEQVQGGWWATLFRQRMKKPENAKPKNPLEVNEHLRRTIKQLQNEIDLRIEENEKARQQIQELQRKLAHLNEERAALEALQSKLHL